jgi:hypothetical protein
MMNEQTIQEFLSSLPNISYQNATTFLTKVIPELASILGYDESQLFFDVDLTWGQGDFLRADAVIAANRTDRPWLLIDAKLIPGDAKHIYPSWIQQIQVDKVISDSQFAVLLTPYFLAILQSPTPREFLLRQYSLKDLSLEQASEIYQLLARPATLPGELSRPAPSNQIIDTDTFKINLGQYSQLLEHVFLAETNDEKKKSLETLAKSLFESIPFLICKHSNLRTASSEIDLVIQYCGSNLLTIFDEFGRHLLVECKNWKSSVGAAQVRDFLVKIQKSRVKLGIIFAKNGISGEHGGANALREIHAAFDAHGIYLLVVSEEDLRAIERGANFYEILDEKIDRIRFDL